MEAPAEHPPLTHSHLENVSIHVVLEGFGPWLLGTGGTGGSEPPTQPSLSWDLPPTPPFLSPSSCSYLPTVPSVPYPVPREDGPNQQKLEQSAGRSWR